jgi:hypothetical protein
VVQKTVTSFERAVISPQRRIAEDKKYFTICSVKFENDDEGQGAKLLKEFEDNK